MKEFYSKIDAVYADLITATPNTDAVPDVVNDEALKIKDSAAIDYIQELAEEGKPIPDNLLPYLKQACDAWRSVNKAKTGVHNTHKKWNAIIYDVYLSWLCGDTLDSAMKSASEKHYVDAKSIKRKYYDPKYSSAKTDAQMADFLFQPPEDWDGKGDIDIDPEELEKQILKFVAHHTPSPEK